MVGGKVRGKSKLLFLIVLVSILVLSSVNVCALEVMTYNIKQGTNVDGIISAIQQANPDLVALQEAVNNANFKKLQTELGMKGYFSQATSDHGGYGVAFLAKPDLQLSGLISAKYNSQQGENRIYQKAQITVDGNKIIIFNTHLSRFESKARAGQIQELYNLAIQTTGQTIVMGDFNEQSSIINNFKQNFISVHPTGNTYKSERIDYIFLSKSLSAGNSQIIQSTASDHLPISSDVSFNPVGAASSPPPTNSGNINEFKTMLILGSHISSIRINRINEAYHLIQQGNFENIIVTGGCGAHDTPPDNCEAKHMAELLLEKGVTLDKIILEEKSKTTGGNYKYSKALTLPQSSTKVINPNDKLLVVSSSSNVKAVAYCFRYKEQVDAYYVKVPSSYTPTVIPQNYDGGSYKSMVNGCRPSGAVSPPSPTQTPSPTPSSSKTPSPGMERFPIGLPKSEEEIDKVWTQIAPLVRPEYKDLIYVPDPNKLKQGTWENFEIHYYEYRVPSAGSTSSPGGVIRSSGTSGPSASQKPTFGSAAINQLGYGYSTTHGITAEDINKAIYENQVGRAKKEKYLGQMEKGLWVDVYKNNLGACMIKMEKEYGLPVAFPMSVMLRTGAVHTKVSGGNCQIYDSASSSGPFYNIFNTKRGSSSSGRKCFIPTTECYSDSKLKSASIQAKINARGKGCTKIGKDAESKCKISQNPHLNYCSVHDSFGGFDSPCQAIESWYKLIAQGSRYKECIDNYRINKDLEQLIYCVPSKGYSTSQTWYGQVKSGTISFVNKWGEK